MKRLLSVVLACAMIFTMVLPMSVFAEGEVTISSVAPVTIEIEDYVGAANSANVYDDEYASGGKYAGQGYSTGECAIETINIPVTVSESGFYDFEYVTSNPAMTDLPAAYSAVSFKIGDTSLAGVATDETLSITPPSTCALANKFKGKAYIEAGTYTLTSTATKAYGVWRFMIDYIKFSPAAADVTIGSSAVTINWNDYKTNTSSSGSEESGLTFVSEDWTTAEAERIMASLVIEVTNEGFYDLEFVTNATEQSYASATVLLDGETLASVSDSTVLEDVSATYPVAKSKVNNAAINKYGKTKVWLDSGKQTLAVSAGSAGGLIRAMAAYIKFAPAAGDPTIDPVISSATFKVGDDGVVTSSYTFTSPLGNADASEFTLKYDGAVVGSFVYGDEIIVPDVVRDLSDYDKTKVSLVATAKDAQGNSGVAVIKFVYIDMTASYAAGAVTPELTIVKGSSAFNAVLLVAFYDTNEAGDKYLLKIEQKHIEVTTDVPYELSDWSATTTVSDADYTGVVPESAEVYLLGCTASTAEQKANPIFYTTLEELACVENITIG